MVSLVEDMDSVPNLRVTNTIGIQNLYAFALNRRNAAGDRDKAITVIHKVTASSRVIFGVDAKSYSQASHSSLNSWKKFLVLKCP